MSSSTKTSNLSKLQKPLMKSVRMTFKPPTEQAPRLSFFYSSMITAVSTNQEDILISAFQIDGYPIYHAKLNGHFLWDTSEAHMCDPGCLFLNDYDSDDDYLVRRRRKKKKKPVFANTPCHTYPPHPPDEPYCPRPLPISNKGLKYLQKTQAFPCKPQTGVPPSPPMVSPCMMFSSSSSSYQTQFPTLGKNTYPSTKVSSQPYVQSPVTPIGQLEEPRPFEAVLNW